MLPYLEMVAVYKNYTTINSPITKSGDWPNAHGFGTTPQLIAARTAIVKYYLCPSDRMHIINESGIPYYIRARGSYRGCVGPGDVYGKKVSTGPAGAGVYRVAPGQCDKSPIAPFRTKLRNISDGSSNTIMYAEALIPNMDNWCTIGDLTLGNMGGSLFSTFLTPNSTSADKVWGPCPAPQGDAGYKAPCVSLGGPNRPPGSSTNNQAGAYAGARSRHIGGVNVALADGSVRFVTDTVDQTLWWALGTASAGESLSGNW